MRKNDLLYMITIVVLLMALLLFYNAYRDLHTVTTKVHRHNAVYGHLQSISRQVNSAAVLHPDLVKARSSSYEDDLFFADSSAILQELALLRSTVRDTVNISIAGKLDTLIRSELGWLLKSNVPDSILHHNSPGHLAALQRINSLISEGIKRTNLLMQIRKEELNDAINKVKTRTIIFVSIFGALLLGTLFNLLEQRSKRKGKEQQLEEQQSLMALIINSSDDAIISKSLDGIITSWNRGAEKVFGYAPRETIGQHISLLVPPELKEEEKAILQKIVAGQTVDHYETERRTKSGETIQVSLTISPIRDAAGKIIGASKISRNITAQKNAEAEVLQLNKEVSQNEKKFRGLIENSSDIVSIFDENFNPVYRSPAAERITGWSNEERDNTGAAGHIIHPDDVEELQSMLQTVFNSPGVPLPLSFRIKHKAGHYLFVEGIFTNMLGDEAIRGIVANFHDVTETRKAQEKIKESERIYRTIASSIPGSVICLLDAEYRYLLIEGDMLEKLGYSKEKLLGSKAPDVIPPERWAQVQPEFERVFSGETFTIDNQRGQYHSVTRFVPLKNESNHAYAALVVVFDVTELKKAEHTLAEVNAGLEQTIVKRTEQLKKSNDELEAFSYSVSHDLRAPLRGIVAFASILEEEYGTRLDDEARRIIAIIRDSTLKMGSLIDDLLSFSRMGKHGMQKTMIDTFIMVTEIVHELQQQNIGATDIEWHIQDLPPVYADVNTLRQVWINLISNAIKYSRKKENPQIEIGFYREREEVIFYVKDNGAGFNEQYKDKLFKVFQRLHDAEEFEGTGVGLALVEKVISRHDGKVWAEGKEEEGACFYFSIPTIITDEEQQQIP